MKSESINFLEYIGTTNTNLTVSLVNLRNEFDIFYNIDGIFLNLINSPISKNCASTKLLCHLAHEQFYFAIKTLLQGSVINAYPAVRIAIESAFIAYIISSEPESDEDRIKYEIAFIDGKEIKTKDKKTLNEGELEIRKIYKTKISRPKAYIKDVRLNDSNKFILSEGLLGMHGFYSSNSHPDFNSFAYRIKLNDDGAPVEYNYFSIPTDKKLFNVELLSVLQDFIRIIRIFTAAFDVDHDKRLLMLSNEIEKAGIRLEAYTEGK